MIGYVVDASVLVKWLVEEEFSTEAATLLGGGFSLVAPALIFAEATNALWSMRRRGDISATDLADATKLLEDVPVSVPVSMLELAASAARLAVDLDHPAYDCFYLALAIQRQYRVVTADKRFHDRVSAHPYLEDRIVHVARIADPAH